MENIKSIGFNFGMSLSRVVAITGCDSGLGWTMAARTAREGFVTVAGMHGGSDTEAARRLAALAARPHQLDVTDANSVRAFGDYVKQLLNDNPNYKLYAVVNNAGVMTIGDHEWQTDEMIQKPIAVNLLGAMRVVSTLLPELRMAATQSPIKPRIINVASHCGLHPLPGFGPYSASKAGVLAWTRALRMELRPYGLSALALVPGGFVTSSNIMSNQINNFDTMLNNLNEEQKSFYEKKLSALANYLLPAAQQTTFDSMKDENIIETFSKALNTDDPKYMYKVETWRYKMYYFLMSLSLPENIHDWIVNKFINFPNQ